MIMHRLLGGETLWEGGAGPIQVAIMEPAILEEPEEAGVLAGLAAVAGKRQEEEEEKEEKEEEIDSCLIDIKGYAEPSGPHSFFLKAEITGHIRCHCDACDGKFNLPVKSGFKLFLDEHATAFGDVSGDLEIVPFPRSTEHVDLTSVARSWIEMNLKEEFLCDECEENDGVVETWSLDYDGEVKITK